MKKVTYVKFANMCFFGGLIIMILFLAVSYFIYTANNDKFIDTVGIVNFENGNHTIEFYTLESNVIKMHGEQVNFICQDIRSFQGILEAFEVENAYISNNKLYLIRIFPEEEFGDIFRSNDMLKIQITIE